MCWSNNGAVDISTDVSLVSTTGPKMADRVRDCLRAIGRPAIAAAAPPTYAALGHVPGQNPPRNDAVTPVSRILWDAPALAVEDTGLTDDTIQAAVQAVAATVLAAEPISGSGYRPLFEPSAFDRLGASRYWENHNRRCPGRCSYPGGDRNGAESVFKPGLPTQHVRNSTGRSCSYLKGLQVTGLACYRLYILDPFGSSTLTGDEQLRPRHRSGITRSWLSNSLG